MKLDAIRPGLKLRWGVLVVEVVAAPVDPRARSVYVRAEVRDGAARVRRVPLAYLQDPRERGLA